MLSACQVFSWKFFNFFRVDNILIVLYQFVKCIKLAHTRTAQKKIQCAKRYALHTAAYNWIYLPCIDNLPMHTDLKTLNLQHFRKNIQQFIQSTSPGVPFFLFYKLIYTPPNAFSWTQNSMVQSFRAKPRELYPIEALVINFTFVDMKINNTTIGMPPKTCSTVVLCRTE